MIHAQQPAPPARFGRLTLTAKFPGSGKARWQCACECGKKVTRRLAGIKQVVKMGGTPSCGCYLSELKVLSGMARFDPTPYMQKRFGRLLVTGVSTDASRNNCKNRLVCLCDCGAQAIVAPMHLTRGKTTSCGCFHSERSSIVAKETATVHAHTTIGELNGHTSIYRAWCKIRSGCAEGWRKGHHLVCHEYDARWDEFKEFYKDFGDIKVSQTISRLDNQLPWSKSNCFVNSGRRAPRTKAESLSKLFSEKGG